MTRKIAPRISCWIVVSTLQIVMPTDRNAIVRLPMIAARNRELEPPVMEQPPSSTAIRILNCVLVATVDVEVPVRRMLKKASSPQNVPTSTNDRILTFVTLTPDCLAASWLEPIALQYLPNCVCSKRI